MAAVSAALDAAPAAAPAALLKQVGMTLVSTVGGASGPLYGTLFLRMAAAAGARASLDAAGRSPRRCGPEWMGVVARGKAETATRRCTTRSPPLSTRWTLRWPPATTSAAHSRRGRGAADAGRDATVPLVARKGRASYLGERSVGHQDPGRPRPPC